MQQIERSASSRWSVACSLIAPLLAAIWSGASATTAAAAVVDEALPGGQAPVFNPEFSSDGSYIASLETVPIAPYGVGDFIYYVWIDTLDPYTGWPGSEDARGIRFDDPQVRPINVRSMPQWGRNDGTPHPVFDGPCPLWNGDFVVWIAFGPGRFDTPAGVARTRVFTDPATGSARHCPEGVLILPEDKSAPDQRNLARFKRSFPFAAKNAGSPSQLISYQIHDRLTDPPGGNFKVLAFDALLATGTLRHELVSEESMTYPFGNIAAGLVNFPSWLPGSSTLYLGVHSGCDPTNRYCPSQVARWDYFAGGEPETVTIDARSKINMIPFLHAGQPSLAAGINNSEDGGHFVRNPGGPDTMVFAHPLLWDPAQSSLWGADGSIDPFTAQSFEAFAWGGDAYVVYQVSENSLLPGEPPSPYAFFYQTEIWLAKLPVGADPVVCKISMDDSPGMPFVRHEPEPVVLDGHAYVFYSMGNLGHRLPEYFEWQLRRIDLGNLSDRAAFDAECALGVTAPPAS